MRFSSTLFLATLLLACSKKDDAATPAPSCSGGSVTLTLAGNTSTQTDGVNAVLAAGKFMGLTDDNADIKIGDSENMDVAVGTVKNIVFIAKVGGVMYGRTRSSSGVQATITGYDGTTISGTFRGNVYRDGVTTNPNVAVSGTFRTTCIDKY